MLQSAVTHTQNIIHEFTLLTEHQQINNISKYFPDKIRFFHYNAEITEATDQCWVVREIQVSRYISKIRKLYLVLSRYIL